jgi:DNA (cytosine-5)-methyltransferase 1
MLTTRGGTRVIADLTQMGYDTKWTVMGAADIGAPHQRDRMWIVAHASSFRGEAGFANTQGWQEGDTTVPINSSADLANPTHSGDVWREWELGFTQQEYNSGGSPTDGSREWWSAEPSVGRVAHGVAHRVDRLKAIGNGQVPLCAASAWRLLTSNW